MSRSVGGILCPGPWRTGLVAIHLCGLPGDIGRTDRPLLDLAPGGVYRAARVTPDAGALLPHRCTLTCDDQGRPSAVCFLWHFPAGRPDWLLASTVSCGVPTFLDRVILPGRDHPTDSPSPRTLARHRQLLPARGEGRTRTARPAGVIPRCATRLASGRRAFATAFPRKRRDGRQAGETALGADSQLVLVDEGGGRFDAAHQLVGGLHSLVMGGYQSEHDRLVAGRERRLLEARPIRSVGQQQFVEAQLTSSSSRPR